MKNTQSNEGRRIAVVTGASRGIGLEVCRQLAKKGHHVILTARNEPKGNQAVETLKKEKLEAEFFPLDVTQEESIQRLARYLESQHGRVDVLVNNAGVFLDSGEGAGLKGASAFRAKLQTIRDTMETNVYGPFLMCQHLIPMMMEGSYGRVVNISSGMGQLSEMNGGWPAYRISKTSLNAVTRIFADETQGKNILVNSVCPGWVRTEMGGPDAERSVEEGADTVVWLATLPNSGPSGGFFRDREPIAW